MKEGGYAEGGMKMRTRSETEGVRAGGVDSQMSMRKYYRPKSEADRKRRDHERMLKNRELANIANARKKVQAVIAQAPLNSRRACMGASLTTRSFLLCLNRSELRRYRKPTAL